MPGKKPVTITLSLKQEKILEEFSRGTHVAFHLKRRATIVLMAAHGESNNEIARSLNIDSHGVALWRSCYATSYTILADTEARTPQKLREAITHALSDQPRPGVPATFTQEQVAAILALSCEDPQQMGFPFSHWTPALLKLVAEGKGIVTSISERQIGRFFKRS